jgi:hypothetical protein
MSSLVSSRHSGLLFGLGVPAAGPSGRAVKRITELALKGLKSGPSAGSSLVFNDLQTLAQECNTEVKENQVFLLAQRFLLALPAYLPAPELALDSDGEISFDWMGSGGRLLTVTLREDGRLIYAARISAFDKDHGTKRFVDSIPTHVLDLVQQVTGA